MPLIVPTADSIGTGIRFDLLALNSALILPDISVVSSDTLAIQGSGSNQTVSVYGLVYGTTGIRWSGGSGNFFVIGAQGIVQGSTSYAISVASDTSIVTNYGFLAGPNGIVSIGTQARFINYGTVQAIGNGNAVETFTASALAEHAPVTFNYGTISSLGFAYFGDFDGTDSFYNFGQVNGVVNSAGGNDFLVNRGDIAGDIQAGTGNDNFDNRWGLVDGDVGLGDGDDVYLGLMDTLVFGLVYGEAGNDTLTGGQNRDEFDGGTGNDVITGHGGNDSLNGGSNNDTLNGSEGEDTVSGGLGNDVILGESGNDLLAGEDDDDRLFGGTGNDQLIGGNGNDQLTGGAGADTMYGGAGSADSAQYSDTMVGLRADLQVTIYNTGDALGDFYFEVENLHGTAQADTLLGDTGANFVSGGIGSDLIDGRLGNDTLSGGIGLDTLIGGSGADIFVFNADPAAGNADTINDYNVANDSIQLAATAFAGLAAGALPGTAFIVGAAATLATHRIIYNSANGQLLFDADGNGAGAAIHFATLTPGLAMVADEFLVA